MSMNQIALTIFEQLTFETDGKRGMRMLGVMLGVKQIAYRNNGVVVIFKAAAKNKCNAFDINLEANDTYTLKFYKIRGFKAEEKEVFSEVYAEDLRRIFEKQTGLCTNLLKQLRQ